MIIDDWLWRQPGDAGRRLWVGSRAENVIPPPAFFTVLDCIPDIFLKFRTRFNEWKWIYVLVYISHNVFMLFSKMIRKLFLQQWQEVFLPQWQEVFWSRAVAVHCECVADGMTAVAESRYGLTGSACDEDVFFCHNGLLCRA